MNIGQRLGLVLLYVVMAGNGVLMLSIFVQILFRAAIERHRRRQFTERNGVAAYTLRRFDGKRGWANTWLPRNPVINHPAQDGNSTGKLVCFSNSHGEIADIEAGCRKRTSQRLRDVSGY